jgi:hypothetical protein
MTKFGDFRFINMNEPEYEKDEAIERFVDEINDSCNCHTSQHSFSCYSSYTRDASTVHKNKFWKDNTITLCFYCFQRNYAIYEKQLNILYAHTSLSPDVINIIDKYCDFVGNKELEQFHIYKHQDKEYIKRQKLEMDYYFRHMNLDLESGFDFGFDY